MTLWERIARSAEELWIALFGWIPTPLGILLRLWAWRWFFHSCGSARFGTGISMVCLNRISIGNNCRIGRLCFLTAGNGKISLDDDSAISPCVHLAGDEGSITIGKKVAIGPGTVIRAANHKFDEIDAPIMEQGHVPGKVVIENNVWIGANCVILPNVRIGEGAIIGAGAVVTRHIPPFTIAAGVPARSIGERGSQTAFSTRAQ